MKKKVITMCLLLSASVHASDEKFLKGGVGLNVGSYKLNNDGESNTQMNKTGAHIKLKVFEQEGHLGYFATPELKYNAITIDGEGKIGTSGRLRIEVGLNGSPISGSEKCDIYAGSSGVFDIEGHISKGHQFYVSVGPETGLICSVGNVLFQLSPSVQMVVKGSSPGRHIKGGGIGIGFKARAMVADKLMLTSEIMRGIHSLTDAPGYVHINEGMRGSINADLVLNDDWMLGSEFLYENFENGLGEDYEKVGGELSVTRSF